MIEFSLLLLISFSVFSIYFRKREFDAYSLALLGSLFYFFPSLTGKVIFSLNNNIYYSTLNSKSLLVFGIFFFAITIFSFIFEKFPSTKSLFFCSNPNNSSEFLFVSYILNFISYYSIFGEQGFALFLVPKAKLIGILGFNYYIWTYSAFFGGVIAFLKGSKLGIVYFSITFLCDFFLGYRFNLVLFALALLFSRLHFVRKPMRFFLAIKQVAPLTILGIVVIVYKQFYLAFKTAPINSIFSGIKFDLNFFITAVSTSEPAGTQMILNEVLATNFSLPLSNLFESFLSTIPFFRQFGASDITFNSLFQTRLFPLIDYGMGGNIWAEMFAYGGWFLLTACIFLYMIGLSVISLLLRRVQRFFYAYSFVLFILVYYSFYLHRCDLAYFLKVQKLGCSVWLLMILAAWCLKKVRKIVIRCFMW